MHSPIAATALLEPITRLPIPPKSAARFAARAFCARLRLPTRTVRKPQAVVALATTEPSRTGEKPRLTTSNRWRMSALLRPPQADTRWRQRAQPGTQPSGRLVGAGLPGEVVTDVGV